MDTKINWDKLQSEIGGFAKRLINSLKELGIYSVCKDLEIDHICVRLKDNVDIDTLKQELEKVGQIISAVNVNGRKIMIIQLSQPLNVGDWITFGIELPYPKVNHNYQDGWEHVEFVLNNAENTIDDVRKSFVEKFPHLNIEKLKDAYSYSEDEPHVDGDQLPNPTVSLKVNGIGLKFHANPIQKVVGYLDTYPLEKFYIYFSPYTSHAIEINNVLFPTLEHVYQCQRYTDSKIIEEIRSAHSPMKAWEVSSKYKHLQIPEFKKPEYKLEVMKKLMRLKVQQHSDVSQALLDSGKQLIIKKVVTYPPGDGFWDIGEDGKGLNHTGRLWMEIRDELRKELKS